MATWPGYSLEAFVGDSFRFDSPQQAQLALPLLVSLYEPARDYVEFALDAYEDGCSWRDYRHYTMGSADVIIRQYRNMTEAEQAGAEQAVYEWADLVLAKRHPPPPPNQ
jgi:hypothetical protein